MKISQYTAASSANESDMMLISRRSGTSVTSLRITVGQILALMDLSGISPTKANLPSDIVYTGDFTEMLNNRVSEICKPVAQYLFEAANVSTAKTCDLSDGTLRANGHYPAINSATPYFINGIWLSQAQMVQVLFDRYTPFMGGVQCTARTNLPVWTKITDSKLSMDYAAVNNANVRSIVLGKEGWTSSVRPASMQRAFDGCPNLEAVIGEIDMTVITRAYDINSLFRNCPKLWQFHLSNVPDAVETLDLSGCSSGILTPFMYAEGQPAVSSLKWLLQNYNYDRTKPLTVKVSAAVYSEVADDPFYAVAGITWASA